VDTVRAWVWVDAADAAGLAETAQRIDTTTLATWPIRAGDPERQPLVTGGRPDIRDTITSGATRVRAPIRSGSPVRQPWNREE
jgi:hypothetical protein